MATKKNRRKKIAGLLIPLGALVILAGVFLWVKLMNPGGEDAAEPAPTAPPQILFANTADAITRMEVTYEEALLPFSLENGIWRCDSEPERPLDQDLLGEMTASLAGLTAKRTIAESPEELSLYGLDRPALTVVITDEDMEVSALTVGDANAVTGDYYCQIAGDAAVYTIAPEKVTPFTLSLEDLTYLEALPVMDTDEIQDLTVTDAQGVTLLALEHLEEALPSDYTRSYLWYVTQGGETRAADEAEANAYAETFTGLTLGSCADYQATQEELAAYELTEPLYTVTVNYNQVTKDSEGNVTKTTPSVFTLYVGKQEGDGTVYVRFDNSPAVYTANASSLTDALTKSARDLWPMDLVRITADELSGMNLSYNGVLMEFLIRNETVEDEEENKSDARIYTH